MAESVSSVRGSDGIYGSKSLEDALKEHYGLTRRMFDTPPSLTSSGKVAVTASAIKDGATFMFANYKGAAPHRVEPSQIFHSISFALVT